MAISKALWFKNTCDSLEVPQDEPEKYESSSSFVKNDWKIINDYRYKNIMETEDIRDAYLVSIKDNPKKLGECYTNYFSQIYTQLWVETLARHIKKVLSDFCKNNQKLLEGWQNNQLSELLQRSDEEWLDIFRFRTDKYKGDAALNCCGYKGMTFLSTLSKHKDPRQPTYCRKQDNTRGSIMR